MHESLSFELEFQSHHPQGREIACTFHRVGPPGLAVPADPYAFHRCRAEVEEETLCEVGIDRVEFEVVVPTARFDMVCQALQTICSRCRDLQHIGGILRLDRSTSSRPSDLSDTMGSAISGNISHSSRFLSRMPSL